MTVNKTAIAPSPGGVIAAESVRFVHRRGLRTTLLGVVVTFVVAVIAMAAYYAPVSTADVDRARSAHAQAMLEVTSAYENCSQTLAAGHDLTTDCGLPPVWQYQSEVSEYFTVQPFLLDITMPHLAGWIGLLFALTAFVMGASWIGAEWSSGSLTLLATFEPRRVRLLAVKAAVLAGIVAGTAIALQASWLLASFGLAHWRGATGPVAWSQLVSLQARSVALAVLLSLAGFALAGLARSTALVLGAALGYVLLVEGALRWLNPAWSRWFLSVDLQAFLATRPRLVTWDEGGQLLYVIVTPLHSAAALTLAVGALLAMSAWNFRRLDLA